MNTNSNCNTCGGCRYFKGPDNSGGGDCHANPPVIVEAFVRDAIKGVKDFSPPDVIMFASRVPNVDMSDRACRFSAPKGQS